MHPALHHKDRKIRSALRQARDAMIKLGKISGVRTIEELADEIMPYLRSLESLGAPAERRDVVIAALFQLREGRLISVHRKTAQARVTTKGRHIDSLRPKQRGSSGRRHGRRVPEHLLG